MGNLIDLTPLFEALIAVCLTALSVFGVPWLRSALDADKLDALEKWVKIAVTAAEQIGRTWKGSEKKQYVLDFLNSRGYTIDDAKIDALIEASVLELHQALYEYTYDEIYDDDDDDSGEAGNNA